jgi:hypothetical protein
LSWMPSSCVTTSHAATTSRPLAIRKVLRPTQSCFVAFGLDLSVRQ